MERHLIEWHIGENVIGSSKISKVFTQGCKMFISLYDVNDSIILNDQ